jgi:MFS family permease
VSFFTDLGSELIYPLLPEFITVTLHAPKAVFGLIEGLAEGTPAVVRYFSGTLSDRVRDRKWLVLTGYTLSSVVKPFIGLTTHVAAWVAPWLVLALRVLDKTGKGIRGAPRDALVADFSEGQQGRAFGYQRAMDHAGAVGGGLCAFILLSWLGLDIAWAIGLSFIPGLLTVAVILLFVHDQPGRAPKTAIAAGSPAAGPPLGSAFHSYLVAAVLFSLANSSDAFLLLRAREMGLAVAYLPLAWAVLHAVKTATSYVGGGLSDRMGRKPVLLFGWLLYAGVYLGFSQFGSVAAAWALFPVYGVFFGATEGVAKAFVADLIPAGTRGRAFGVLGMAEGLTLIPTSFFIGWLWDQTGSGHWPLLVNAFFALAAAGWLAFRVRPPRPTNALAA